jgi:hypothetical protein
MFLNKYQKGVLEFETAYVIDWLIDWCLFLRKIYSPFVEQCQSSIVISGVNYSFVNAWHLTDWGLSAY